MCLSATPTHFFYTFTKVNYFSIKEFERFEAVGEDDGSFKYFSSFVQVSECVTDLGIRR